MYACRVGEVATARVVVDWLTDCGVQVFRHDPLYSWTQRMQAEEGGAAGAAAGAGEGDGQEADGAPEAGDEGVVGNNDAILRVQQKLQVME